MGTIDMIHDTLRLVMLEAVDAYRALNEDSPEAALDHLRNLMEHARVHVETSNIESAVDLATRQATEALVAPCELGYETIIGWQLKHGRYDVQTQAIADIVHDSLLDSRIVMQYIKKFAPTMTKTKVEAPSALQERGIETINAYPIDILADVFGD